MQQTSKYKLNLIDPSDDFSPDPLNANANTLETQLLAREAAEQALDGKVSAEATAREAADNTLRTDFAAADSALKSELTAADAAVKTELNGAIDSAKSTLNSSIQSLQTALGSGGKNARASYGTFAGDGKAGAANARRLSFSFQPDLVVMGSLQNVGKSSWPSVFMRGSTRANSDNGSSNLTISWSGTSVSWYATSSSNPEDGNNADGRTYYYVAIGE